jgi:N-acetylglucosaminyldiphosphoundecaprenol N-acetyl-beta-D-mannosaminyltransferase
VTAREPQECLSVAEVRHPVRVAGVPIWLPDRETLIAAMRARLGGAPGNAPPATLYTLNPEILMRAARDPDYAGVLTRGTWNVVDGVGLELAVRRAGIRVPARHCGSDMVYLLAALAREANRAMLLIGGDPARLRLACANLERLYPGLVVEGVSPPYSHGLPLVDEARLDVKILKLRPGVVIACLGAPRQEQWLDSARPLLRAADVRIAGGFGGAVDFVSNAVPRAPVLLRRLGLEWAFRLAIEPRRLRRQASSLPAFAWRALTRRGFCEPLPDAARATPAGSAITLYAHYMPPRPSASATRMFSLARALSADGHAVRLLTSQPGPSAHEGIPIVRCRGRAGLIRWLLANRSGSILVSSPPGTPAAEVAWLARLTGRRVIVDVRDPYVSEALAIGDLAQGPATLVKAMLERSLFRSAHAVSVVSAPLLDTLRVTLRLPIRNASIAANGADLHLFRIDAAARERIRAQWGWGDEAVFVYAGILGGKELDRVLQALAPALRAGARFLMIGVVDEHSQSIRDALVELALHEGVADRVTWLENLSLHDVAAHLNAADVGVNPLPRARLYCMPVKTYEYMACGLYNLACAATGGGLASLIDDPAKGAVAGGWDEFSVRAVALAKDVATLRGSAPIRADLARAHGRDAANAVLIDLLTRDHRR